MSSLDDHSVRAKHDPPEWSDRLRRRKLTVTVTALSMGTGAIVAWDVLLGKTWLASYVLQYVPNISQLSMSALLALGGFFTIYGAVVRHKLRREKDEHGVKKPRERLSRLVTINTEMWGWFMQAAGWITTLVPMWDYHRPGSLVSLWIMSMVCLGCSLKTMDLYLLGREVRREIVRGRKAESDLEYVRGERA